MRTSLSLAALLSLAGLLLAPLAYAADMPMKADAKSQTSQASADQKADQNSDQKADQKSSQTAQAAQQSRPFHRQPIFLGMLRRNNDIRRRAGLFPHRINPALTAAAQDHANYMARTGQFSHYVNGGPQYRANRYGFRGGVRENIAYGTASIDGAFNMWTNSGAHYASIVSGTTEAGFGYAVSASGQAYWVGVYASPAQGDTVGETEALVAAALAEEAKAEAERKEAEKNVAQDQAGEANVASASAEVPVEASADTPAANPAPQNPAGNANVTNARPGNTYYYNNNGGRNRRWFRRS